MIIKTNKGIEIEVDDEDFDYLSQFNWTFDTKGNPIVGWGGSNEMRGRSMRQLIVNNDAHKKKIYYLDGNPLNNKKENIVLTKNKITLHNDYGEITLKDNKKALFSLCDIDLVKSYTWVLLKIGYIVTEIGGKKRIFS